MKNEIQMNPTSVVTLIEQHVNAEGNVTSISVTRRCHYAESSNDTETVQRFDLSVIPYDVALSLACQIVTGFRTSQSK